MGQGESGLSIEVGLIKNEWYGHIRNWTLSSGFKQRDWLGDLYYHIMVHTMEQSILKSSTLPWSLRMVDTSCSSRQNKNKALRIIRTISYTRTLQRQDKQNSMQCGYTRTITVNLKKQGTNKKLNKEFFQKRILQSRARDSFTW